jgi:hypothetical protein
MFRPCLLSDTDASCTGRLDMHTCRSAEIALL